VRSGPPSSRLPYVPELDGLRASAVFAVIASHTVRTIVPGGGSIGVDLFFVLSGFLITRILVSEFESTGTINFLNFYARRCLRLMPALWLFLFVFVSGAIIVGGSGERDRLLAALSAGLYFMNWTKALNLGPAGMLGHTWSLAVEEQFYIVWPLLLLLILKNVQRSSRWIPMLLGLLASAAWRDFLVYSGAGIDRVYSGFDTRAETLLFGCLLAVLPIDRLGLRVRHYWYMPLLFLFLCLFILPNQDPSKSSWQYILSDSVGISLIALCAAWVIMLILEYRKVLTIPVVSWGPVVYLGRISYGIYLWHYPINLLLRPYVPGPLNFILTGTASVLIAAASFHLIEAPALRLKARFNPQGHGSSALAVPTVTRQRGGRK
jgi:peptidoglycan/LPS O-acetylase OafA/YrhL